MSRLGKKPVEIPPGVTVTVTKEEIKVKGPRGELRQPLVPGIELQVRMEERKAWVTRSSDTKAGRALHGTYRSLLQNMVRGVTEGYEKRMRIVGTGYRVELKGKTLVITAGYCHPVNFPIPPGIEIEVPKPTSREFMDFIVRGIDKQYVGEIAARLRRVRPPDLYKGKGIRYADEQVRRLEGKSLGA